MKQLTAAFWKNKLELLPHPEGGYYKEVYRSKILINTLLEGRTNSACTSIYYLLEGIFKTFLMIFTKFLTNN